MDAFNEAPPNLIPLDVLNIPEANKGMNIDLNDFV